MEDSLCGHVRVIRALALGHGSHAFGGPSLAIDDDEGQPVWLIRVEREFVPDDVEMSRFLNGVGELARTDVDGLVPLTLLDRELEFAVVGWQALDGATPLLGRGGGVSAAALRDNAMRLAGALTELHVRGRVHGMACPANAVRLPDGRVWWWMFGVADCVDHTAFLAVPPRPAEGLAPEIARGEVSAASDVYGWATTLVVLAQAGSLQECIAAARAGAGVFGDDPSLTALLVRALDAEPGRRPTDGEALLAALQQSATATSPRASAVPAGPPPLPPPPPFQAASTPARVASNAAGGHPGTSLSHGASLAPGDSLAGLATLASPGAPVGPVGWGGGSASMGLPLPQRPLAQRDAISLDDAPPLDLPDPVDLDDFGDGSDPDAAESLDAGVLELAEDGPIVSEATSNLYASFDRALTQVEGADADAGAIELALDDGIDRAPRSPGMAPGAGATAGGAGHPAGRGVGRGAGHDVGAGVGVLGSAVASGTTAGRSGGDGPRLGGIRPGEAAPPTLAATPGIARPVDAPLEVVEVRRRRSGPHGPGVAVMNGLAWVLATAAVGIGVAALVAKVELPDAPRADAPTANAGGGEGTGPDAATATAGGEGTTGDDATLVLEDPPVAAPEPPRPCPTGTVEVSDDVCIDVGEYPGLRRMPTRNVTLDEAEATCKARDARLCSLEEWRAACGGPNKQRFPYGATFVRGACNVASIAGFYGEAVQGGSYAECISAIGALDMVGNVGEWVQGGVAVGGDFATAERDATCQAKGNPPRGYSGGEVGFRCCVDRRPTASP